MVQELTERYAEKIRGVLSCFDRAVITGTIPQICYAEAMTRELKVRGIRIFDYTQFAEPLRDEIRYNAERLAQENGLEIEFIRRRNFRKEARVREILEQRGELPGLVHIFSAMESCASFRPWHNKKTGQTLPPTQRREVSALHYYFYFVDERLGLCYLRVPTWAPFRLQFYFNRHNQLAAQLRQAGIGFPRTPRIRQRDRERLRSFLRALRGLSWTAFAGCHKIRRVWPSRWYLRPRNLRHRSRRRRSVP